MANRLTQAPVLVLQQGGNPTARLTQAAELVLVLLNGSVALDETDTASVTVTETAAITAVAHYVTDTASVSATEVETVPALARYEADDAYVTVSQTETATPSSSTVTKNETDDAFVTVTESVTQFETLPLRFTQDAIEVMGGAGDSELRISQAAVEVIGGASDSKLRFSQAVIEVLGTWVEGNYIEGAAPDVLPNRIH